MKKLGLIGGISWVSTIDYYRYINEGVNKKLGGLNAAECIIYSVNFNDFVSNNTAGNWDGTLKLMADASNALEKAGAEAIVLCANTAHAVAGRLKEQITVPLIDIIGATAEEIHRQGLRKVGLIATKFTMEMDFYINRMKALGITVNVPERESDRQFIQQTLKDELGVGIIKQTTKDGYLRIINELIAAGGEGIILGCTELPLILSQQDVSVPVFESTRIHAEAALSFMFS